MIIGRYSKEQTRFLRRMPPGWHLDTAPTRRQRWRGWRWWRDADVLIGVAAVLILLVALAQTVLAW